MLIVLLAVYTLYTTALSLNAPGWIQSTAAFSLALGPLSITLANRTKINCVLPWVTVTLHCGLAVFLLVTEGRNNKGDLALDAVLFTVYMGAALHFWSMYRRRTAGAIISITGFFLWANVFTVAPVMGALFPRLHLEGEVWNLPKYVVAVGMILLLLEDQIAHNKHLAFHDALTGLPNRRLFQDRLTGALERAHRMGTRTALLMMDLDGFKQVNDTWGHHTGDLLLQHVATLFDGRIRRSDTLARTGGDEFAVILEGPINMMEAMEVGNSLLELLIEPIRLKDSLVKADASLGFAIFPDDAQDMEQLLIAADVRMYEFKRNHASPIALEAARQADTIVSVSLPTTVNAS